MKYDTKARERLRALGLKSTEIAKRLDISQPAVSRWLNGDSRPDPESEALIEAAYGVPRDEWLTRAEQAAMQERLRAVSVPAKAS